MNIDVSIIIPARNEMYLEKTIRDILANAESSIEVIVLLDGYIPEPQIVTNDDRVNFIHHQESIGQRQSINEGARLAKGKFIMKLDAHCALDKGFDVKLMADCEYNWTVIPRMYNLDIETWKPKLHKKTDYMYIGWNEKNELRSLYYTGLEWKKWHARTEDVDDTMGLMGPCFFMHKDRFWELGGCDEGHGSWGSQGIEIACKSWLSGGRLVVNKNTWFAHWFRGNIGFPYPMSGKQVENARKYSESLWLKNKWDKQVRPFQFLIDKFNPPSWENKKIGTMRDELQKTFYHNVHLKGHDPKWRGTTIVKLPTDLILYAEAIFEKKPDFIIDIGTRFGGSALMFQDLLDINGGGQVITIDKFPDSRIKRDPRIFYLEGGSTSEDILNKVKTLVSGKVMLSIDGDHRRPQVKRELMKYKDIVTPGQYMVVEDCYGRNGELVGPGEARDWFLKRNKQFKKTNFDEKYLVGFTKDGWLLKK